MSPDLTTPDLTTTYLGFRLRSPLVASAGPTTGDPSMWAGLDDAGIGAIVLPSLFEEQIELESMSFDALSGSGTDIFGEALDFLPGLGDVEVGPARHLALVEAAAEFFDIPVIASLNGTSPGGWATYARYLVDAGADALELNLYDIVVDPDASAGRVESGYLDLVADVRAEITVPLAVKIGSGFTAPLHFARSLVEAGADGIVVFNRFYQPEIDLDTLDVVPRLHLSGSEELALRAHWIGILHGRVRASLAGTGGVHTSEDVLRLLLSGADAAMTTSAVLRDGPARIVDLLDGVRSWMIERDYDSVTQLIGSVSRDNARDPHAYERANYVRTIHSWHR